MVILNVNQVILVCFQIIALLILNGQTTLSLSQTIVKQLYPGQLNNWHMAKAFGDIQGTKHWILHYNAKEDLAWTKVQHVIAKDMSNFGYITINRISSINTSYPVRLLNQVTLNLYVNENLEPLDQMLQKEGIMMKPRKTCQQKCVSRGAYNIWLIKLPTMPMSIEAKASLNKLHVGYDTLTFGFTSAGTIYDLFRVNTTSDVILNEMGTWIPDHQLQIPNPDIWSRRASLQGLHLKVTSVYSPPAVTYIEDNCNTTVCFRGMFADVLHALSEQMNFTYTVQRSYRWGAYINGTWDGMVGQLIRGEADIAAGDLARTKERAAVVEYLPSLIEVDELLFLRNPADSTALDAYRDPLTPISWLSIAILIAIIPLILATMDPISPEKDANKFGITHSYHFVLKTLVMQGGDVIPSAMSIKIAFASVLLAGILFYYYWESSLYSFLATRRSYLPFRSLNDLDKTSQYKLLTPKGTFLLDLFRYSNDPLYKKVWEEKMKPYVDEFPLYEDLATALLNDPYSVGYAESIFNQNEAYLNCEIVTTGISSGTAQLSWAIQQQSPFQEAFDYHIRKLKEVGAVQRYSKIHEAGDQVCPDYSGMPIDFKQCITAFYVLLSGAIGCTLWFLLEIVLPRNWMMWITTISNRLFYQMVGTRTEKNKGNQQPSSHSTLRDNRWEHNEDILIKRIVEYQNGEEYF